ncbi:MAG: 30S ribosomal protein S2 [Chloroflexi bacterium]|nr:30S ribosomal protein S2 [Chloroflexota bacterium]
MKSLLEAGVHFGHQTRRWNPKMKRYIFTQRNGIHIIDLQQTVTLLEQACDFVKGIAAQGGKILFVGTKKQAQEVIEEEAKRCGMFYAHRRWLGGTLTNFATIQARIDYLVRQEDRQSKGELMLLPKKEASKLEEEIARLNRLLGGIKEMTALPDVLYIVDTSRERIAVAEAQRVGVPIVAVTDTNCNPDEVNHIIPANDDAIKAIRLITSLMADAVLEGKAEADEAQLMEPPTAPEISEVPESGVPAPGPAS